ncbi:MAG: hypothetical protein AVDCRST_MAG18-2039 [uncultured Thermomicrobiales bacterium]|uniref:SLH domain-containing protein n=1 Tax=uncultured Thermomicrobiales bacterium TaxID=1645740 RepID=A0A6J4V821_9BACT|nr:MAG: hypothetical protein AVDCRST_MAG18-2039 [uncultured Thermomicrobiales bacterium]
MVEPTMREILVELTALRAEVHQQRRAMGRARRLRRPVPLMIVALLVALLPLSLLAAAPTFSDLNVAAEVHRGNIQAIGNAGITAGLVDPSDPNARLYNPQGPVTREEMTSFLARTAGLGGNPPVTNAATVGGLPASGLARINRAPTVGPITLTSSPQVLTTTTLDAPGPGFALVSGAGVFYAAPGETNAMASVRVRYVEGSAASPPLYAVIGTIPATALEQSLSPVWMFRLPEGGTRTFVIEALIDPASTGAVVAANVALTALYVPFGPTGAQASASDMDFPAEGWPRHP